MIFNRFFESFSKLSRRFKVGYCYIDGSGTCTAAQAGGRRLHDEHEGNRRLEGTAKRPPTWTSPNNSEFSARRRLAALSLLTPNQCSL